MLAETDHGAIAGEFPFPQFPSFEQQNLTLALTFFINQTRAIAPMLVLQFASLADDSTNRKESKIELAVQAFTLAMQANMPLADELKEFFKAPEGVRSR